jgi:hypothetical protein
MCQLPVATYNEGVGAGTVLFVFCAWWFLFFVVVVVVTSCVLAFFIRFGVGFEFSVLSLT